MYSVQLTNQALPHVCPELLWDNDADDNSFIECPLSSETSNISDFLCLNAKSLSRSFGNFENVVALEPKIKCSGTGGAIHKRERVEAGITDNRARKFGYTQPSLQRDMAS